MKQILTLFSLLSTSFCFSQKAKLINDTIYYQTDTLYNGKAIQLSYGSRSDKNFAFVSIGSALTGVSQVESGMSKTELLIDKVYKQNGKCIVRAKMVNKPSGIMPKVFIDVEGAIDNKELVSH